MKPQAPALFDFRFQLTAEVDLVLTAKARSTGTDKAAVAREVLAHWAQEQRAFCEALQAEEGQVSQRVTVHIRRKAVSRRVQNAVFSRDGFKCVECGLEPGSPSKLHIDHIIPISAGGSNDLINLRVLCEPCNLAKSDKIVAIESARK